MNFTGTIETLGDTVFVWDSSATAIQDAINIASAEGKNVMIPSGTHVVNTTINIPGGMTISGAGRGYRGETQYSGTTIYMSDPTRPLFNFTGVRGARLKDMWLIGQHNVGLPNEPEFLTNYTVTGTDLVPHAGITIDLDGGFPSSKVTIENVGFAGWDAGVVVQPGDFDANGDFIKIRDCHFENCVWGVSVGNGQCRNLVISDFTALSLYGLLTNRQHGRKIGHVQGTIQDGSIDHVMRLFDLNTTASSGPLTFLSVHGENMYQLGFAQNASNSSPIMFIQSKFKFNGQLGMEAPVLIEGGTGAEIIFNGGIFQGRSDYPLGVSNVDMNGLLMV